MVPKRSTISRKPWPIRSADFLDVVNYPVLTFESKQVERIGDNYGRLIGDLTIRGPTREVTLNVQYAGQYQDPWGGLRAGFSGSTTINHKDWGLTWNVALEAGGFLVSDKIGIEIELELIRQTESQAA
jgi:polyisoprenoid-binding protein YceI